MTDEVISLVKKLHNDQDLGQTFRTKYPENELCKTYTNDFDLGKKIRSSYFELNNIIYKSYF